MVTLGTVVRSSARRLSHDTSDSHEFVELFGSRFRGVTGPNLQCWTLTGNGYTDA